MHFMLLAGSRCFQVKTHPGRLTRETRFVCFVEALGTIEIIELELLRLSRLISLFQLGLQVIIPHAQTDKSRQLISSHNTLSSRFSHPSKELDAWIIYKCFPTVSVLLAQLNPLSIRCSYWDINAQRAHRWSRLEQSTGDQWITYTQLNRVAAVGLCAISWVLT